MLIYINFVFKLRILHPNMGIMYTIQWGSKQDTAHPLHPIDNRSRSAETCWLDDVFPPDDLGSRPEALFLYIYIYIYIPYMSSVIGRIYIYIYIYRTGVSLNIGEAAPHHVL